MAIPFFIVAAGAVNVLNGIGYEHPQLMVIAAALVAGGVVGVLK